MNTVFEPPSETSFVANVVDHYELLVNGRDQGPINQIQVSKEIITEIHGIMMDLDIKYFQKPPQLPNGQNEPTDYYRQVVSLWLKNNEVLVKAEVRNSGTGLHVIIWFHEPVSIESDLDRDRWDCIIKTVQSCLPIDPAQPSITCCTRPLGSINSKNGATVTQLAAGEPVAIDSIHTLCESMAKKPFSTVCEILFGSCSVSPCPVCNRAGTALAAYAHIGKCYHCNKVQLAQLFNTVFKTIETE